MAAPQTTPALLTMNPEEFAEMERDGVESADGWYLLREIRALADARQRAYADRDDLQAQVAALREERDETVAWEMRMRLKAEADVQRLTAERDAALIVANEQNAKWAAEVRRLMEGVDACQSKRDTLAEEVQRLTEALQTAREEREAAKRAHAANEGTIRMVIHSIGGMVEGRPTERVNFLQRVNALVAAEQAICAKCEDEAAGKPALSHSRGYRDACVEILAILNAGAALRTAGEGEGR